MRKPPLLVLTPRFPYPPIGGDRVRILHVCRALRTQFSLTLLSLCETREEMRFEPHDGLFTRIHRVLLPRWRSYLNVVGALGGERPLQLAYYESKEFHDAVRLLAPHHDLVLAHLIRTGQYVTDVSGVQVPRILEMTDAISLAYRRMRYTPGNRSWRKWIYGLEQRRLERYERDVLRRFDRVWLSSHIDRRFLDSNETCSVDVIPNGTDLEAMPFRAPEPAGDAIVFIGNMVSMPNQDACEWFIREILPRVRHRARVTFRIVGNAPEAIRRRFRKHEGVEVTGRIEHIRDGIAGAFCGVCPLRASAGIQNKVLEYLALGLPCVTSAFGLGGVDAQPGREVLVYGDPDEAARQILALHADPQLRMELSAAGRALVERRYDWSRIYEAFRASATETRTRFRPAAGDDGAIAAA